MPIDVSLLLTRADCDGVTTVLDERLRLLENREENFEYRDEVGTKRAAALVQELSGLNARVPFLTTYLATLAADTAEHEKTTDELRRATDRRDELTAQQRKLGGVRAVVSQSSLKETLARTNSLVEDKALVLAHRATLSA